MDAGALAVFWAVSFLFVVTLGADWAYAIAAGVRDRRVVPAVGGLLVGHLVATAAVAAGVASLVARPPVVQAAGDQSAASTFRVVVKGAGVSGLNPKLFFLFLALLPQFTDPGAGWPLWVQIGLLGMVHVASCAVVYLVVGTGARAVLRSRPAAARVVTRISGVAMVVLGIGLLVRQIS